MQSIWQILLAKLIKNILRGVNFTNFKTSGGYIVKSKPQEICLQLDQIPWGNYDFNLKFWTKYCMCNNLSCCTWSQSGNPEVGIHAFSVNVGSCFVIQLPYTVNLLSLKNFNKYYISTTMKISIIHNLSLQNYDKTDVHNKIENLTVFKSDPLESNQKFIGQEQIRT